MVLCRFGGHREEPSMTDLLKFIDDRLGEPSTYASLATLLALLHVNVDPGLMHAITLWGAGAAAVLGFLLTEKASGKTPTQILNDLLAAAVTKTNAPSKP